MRPRALAALFLPMFVASPVGAGQYDAASWVGLGYEICPQSPGFPCSYYGESIECHAALAGGVVDCQTVLSGATMAGMGCVTKGDLSYRDDAGNSFVVPVTIEGGNYQGSTVTAGGPVIVSGTLHPLTGALRRWPYGVSSTSSGSPSCPSPA